MEKSDLLLLYEYNDWAARRIQDQVLQVTMEQFLAPAGASHGSLSNTLAHLLSAEWIWRMRCQEQISPTAMLDGKDFPTPQVLVERWREEQCARQAYLEGLSNQDLNQVISYRRTSGPAVESVLWHILVHLVNHGTQHRAEAAMLLTQAGHSPGDVDFIVFLRQQK